MKYGVSKIAASLIIGASVLASCYSAMPISNVKTSKESESTSKTVIVCYDPAIGTDAIESFIKKNHIKVLYRYTHIKGYALKLQSDKQRKALEKTKGVLTVKDDQVMQLQ